MIAPFIKMLGPLIGLAVLTGSVAIAQEKKPTQSARQSKTHVRQGANVGGPMTPPPQSKPVDFGGKIIGYDPSPAIRRQMEQDAQHD